MVSSSNGETLKGFKKTQQLTVHQPTIADAFQLSGIFYTMKLFSVAAVLGLATLVFSHTGTYIVSFDNFYDQMENSLSDVACSNGEHGLLTYGYTTFGSLPTFPYIGGAPQIQSWNSRYCGSCWALTYTDRHGVSTSLNITAINTGDYDPKHFIISFEGMAVLTNGRARRLDSVSITAALLPGSLCGL